MKSQATHIRLIRENGKPVEAEYENPFIAESNPFGWLVFEEWSQANRIPVTGDWPTDKDVFEVGEVEEVEQYSKSDIPVWIDCDNFNTRTWAIRCGYHARVALRLKALLKHDDLMTCNDCGLPFDRSDLSQVFAHEHQNPAVIEGEYKSKRVEEQSTTLESMKEQRNILQEKIETLQIKLRALDNKIYWTENPNGNF